ncbi:MAG: hypothetical protein BA863_02380 [Desulfovibrio sp. S3730MH75]|nr:MAG: hypothetical protein BA863_02380 [Desulfovibrio sp. S3730MH75]
MAAVLNCRNLFKGDLLTKDDLVCKQPLGDAELFFTGLELNDVVGMKVLKDIIVDTPIVRSLV